MSVGEFSTLCIDVEDPRDLRSVEDPDPGPTDCTVKPTLTLENGKRLFTIDLILADWNLVTLE